jgi:hypothetical protein
LPNQLFFNSMTNETADKLRATINTVQDMRNNLVTFYNVGQYKHGMEFSETKNLGKAIKQMDISLRKMGKRLLTERINLT